MESVKNQTNIYEAHARCVPLCNCCHLFSPFSSASLFHPTIVQPIAFVGFILFLFYHKFCNSIIIGSQDNHFTHILCPYLIFPLSAHCPFVNFKNIKFDLKILGKRSWTTFMDSNARSFMDLAGMLPPCIARREVGKFLGGAVSPKTLANADSLGRGPENRFKAGRNIVYETRSLLQWLDSSSANKLSQLNNSPIKCPSSTKRW